MQSKCSENLRISKCLALAVAAGLGLASRAMAQSNVSAGQVVISSAGSTALKNWIVKNTTTFTDINPYSSAIPNSGTLSIGGVSYPSAGQSDWSTYNPPGSANSYQLAPKSNTSLTTGGAQQSAAVQFLYHESGSVEGILELANDQLYTNDDFAATNPSIPATSINYVTANIDRNPEGGNAVWANYNQIGASGTTVVAGSTFNAQTGAAPANTTITLGNFYAPGVGQTGTPGVTTTWTPGSSSNPLPTFSTPTTGVMAGAGVNVNGGQNAVQFALSDAVPQQVFANDYGNASNTYTSVGGSSTTVTGLHNTSFNSAPIDQGYGGGNTALATASLGTPGSRAVYQSASVLTTSTSAQNPRAAAGTDFAVGSNPTLTYAGATIASGLGNLNSQLTAVTATAFVANPGTGLQELDRTDADWLEMTGHLKNGAGFNMTTRDVNSGTRDVSALDTGVDPTYATGKNDEGNGNLPDSVSNSVMDQESIGPAERFSNKTAGGAQLRPTVQNNRMAVGTLSINDAFGNDTQSKANPVRVLSYSDSLDGSTSPSDPNGNVNGYVSPNYQTMLNGTYVIYQNEQVVTLKNMSSPTAYANSYVSTAANGAQVLNGTIQGDDANGDVVTLLNNTANAVATALNNGTVANPADGLLSQGFIVPQLMQVEKNFNGQGLIQNNAALGQLDSGSIQSQANPVFVGISSQLYQNYVSASGYGALELPILGSGTNQQPTTGSSSSYGGAGGTFNRNFFNGNDNGSTSGIGITNNNYLFGNFNQNGVRDENAAVESGLSACEALISAEYTANPSVSVPGSEFTAEGDNNLNWNGPATLSTIGVSGLANSAPITYTTAQSTPQVISGLTKGDLIVMGDFNGDGHFDGADLYDMAVNSSLADTHATDTLTPGSATIYQNGVLNKNQALSYLDSHVSTLTLDDQYIRKTAAAVLTASSAPATVAPYGIPFGASPVINPVSGTETVDPVTGLPEFTYDPTGANAFKAGDVNRDGVIDFNDAVAVDNVSFGGAAGAGYDYTNIADEENATMEAPVTGQTVPMNLVMVNMNDNKTVIDSTDVTAVSGQLTGTGNTNWYAGLDSNSHVIPLAKNGPNTITYSRTGGTVTVYPGAIFQINSGAVTVNGTLDPFTDNNAPGTGSTAGNHVAIVNNGTLSVTGALKSTVAGITGTGTLNIGGATSTVQLAPNSGASAQGALSISSTGTLDITNNHFAVADVGGPDDANFSSILSWVKDGATNSPGGVITSTSDLPNYGVGVVDGNDGVLGSHVSAGTIEVAYTLDGDANLDGKVDITDFNIFAPNFGSPTTLGWEAGDFGYFGNVNIADFNLFAGNFGQSDSGTDVGLPAADFAALSAFAAANGITTLPTASVPEPASVGLLLATGVGLLARRRRRN